MTKQKFILGLLGLLVTVPPCWQIASDMLATYELRLDLRDISRQNGARIGLYSPASDDQLRYTAISDAKYHGILLEPRQVIIRRIPTDSFPILYVSADYTLPVNLFGYSLPLHFIATSDR